MSLRKPGARCGTKSGTVSADRRVTGGVAAWRSRDQKHNVGIAVFWRVSWYSISGSTSRWQCFMAGEFRQRLRRLQNLQEIPAFTINEFRGAAKLHADRSEERRVG